ncbi:hypothetical protein VN12_04135 [Pirellula sp. SH-Sr6A]|uniref:hypothetical protein n=1 Tax=Pirellula sp. SH-Sr6A TaxID=1632865 RepID=UPI00078E7305|nr:hypothetical protein [Pirellula sp. SH-Sr6A]AMV31282.1 hypothetical protein VN12_04135 [Pirellula sp. SH-Sr6A]
MAYSKLARTSDPMTSHDAAAGIGLKLTARAQQFLAGLEKLGQATANEVAVSVAGGNIGLVGSIRRRASDLDELGLIRVCGRRVCSVTGKPVSCYEIVPQKKTQLELF